MIHYRVCDEKGRWLFSGDVDDTEGRFDRGELYDRPDEEEAEEEYFEGGAFDDLEYCR